MTTTAAPIDEATRQRALDRYHVLDSLPEPAYDDIVQLASTLCDTPTALITLIDRDRQWFKARTGFDESQTSRSVAVCDHAIRAPGQLMEVEDLRRDARFATNPYVNGESGEARFYAGMPLVTADGAAIGTVCVVDDRPRALNETQREALKSLARMTMRLFEARTRERELAGEAFVAAVATPAPQDDDAPGYLLALLELQDLAGTSARLGERATDKLLQRIDAALEAELEPGSRDAVTRSSGSGEYVLVLHGAQAGQTLARLLAAVAREGDPHGLRFLVGSTRADATEPVGQVFVRADAALIERKGSA